MEGRVDLEMMKEDVTNETAESNTAKVLWDTLKEIPINGRYEVLGKHIEIESTASIKVTESGGQSMPFRTSEEQEKQKDFPARTFILQQ